MMPKCVALTIFSLRLCNIGCRSTQGETFTPVSFAEGHIRGIDIGLRTVAANQLIADIKTLQKGNH